MSGEASDIVGETIIIDETRLGRFQVAVKSGTSTFLVDEPAAAGGMGSGPNPFDLLSAALGSCTLMTIRLYADRKKLPLSRVRVKVTHRRSALLARDVFATEILLEGGLDEAQKTRLLEVADHCPVHMTLHRGSEVRTTLIQAPMRDEPSDSSEHMKTMDEACAK